jgi:uncharacterized membrane protein YfcA
VALSISRRRAPLRRTHDQTFAKRFRFASNAGSLLFFMLGGTVVWAAGLAMAAGQVIGARLGAHAVLAKGALLVRPSVVLAAFAMAVRLLLI